MAATTVGNFSFGALISYIYQWIQIVIAYVFAPKLPQQQVKQKPLGHVAVIGAGITGISTASHLIGHGFEVTIFDQADEIGGIWSRVNSTSGLQISSIMYRFHPAVKWTKGYPHRDEILKNTQKIWKMYELDQRTRLGFKVEKVTRHSSSTDPHEQGHARWVINGNESEVFDGVVVTTGTCGKPKKMDLPAKRSSRARSSIPRSSTASTARARRSSSLVAVRVASRLSSSLSIRAQTTPPSSLEATSGSFRATPWSTASSPCSRLDARPGSR